MNDLICSDCGHPLQVLIPPQRFLVRGVEVDLAHCINPDCSQFELTRSYNERPIPADELARIWTELGRVMPAR